MTILTPLPPARLTARLDSGGSHAFLRVVRPGEQPRGRVVTYPRRPATRPRAVACEQSHAPDLHGSRLTPRGRLVVAMLWVVLAAAAASAVLLPRTGTTDVGKVETTTVVVEAGDTMWGLARSIDAEADPRAVIDTIVELNGLRSGADIRPGDVLLVPVGP